MKKIFTIVIVSILLTIPKISFAETEPLDNSLEARNLGYVYNTSRYIETGIWNTSAYCTCEKCCGEYSDGKTYDETVVDEYNGTQIVALPKEYPMGTKMFVDGYGMVECHDRGGAIVSDDDGYNRLDILEESHKKALEYERMFVEVYIVKQTK